MAGVEVRCYNPPRFDSPLGWLSRDHRKMLSVDRRVSFISGLCVGNMWVGDPRKNIAPWRDTGIELRGPGVTDVESAFAQIWAMLGKPLHVEESIGCPEPVAAGVMNVRIVGSLPVDRGDDPHGSIRCGTCAKEIVVVGCLLRRHHVVCTGVEGRRQRWRRRSPSLAE